MRALLDRDEPDEAAAALALIDAHIVAPGFFAAWRHDAAARLHAYRGDHEAARDAWLECGEHATSIRATNPAIWPWRSGAALAMAAQAAHGAGDGNGGRAADREALALAREELALAERFGGPRAIGVAHRARGVITGDDAHHARPSTPSSTAAPASSTRRRCSRPGSCGRRSRSPARPARRGSCGSPRRRYAPLGATASRPPSAAWPSWPPPGAATGRSPRTWA